MSSFTKHLAHFQTTNSRQCLLLWVDLKVIQEHSHFIKNMRKQNICNHYCKISWCTARHQVHKWICVNFIISDIVTRHKKFQNCVLVLRDRKWQTAIGSIASDVRESILLMALSDVTNVQKHEFSFL